MTGTPDLAAPVVEFNIEGLATPTYRLYPLADHVADKLAAINETHLLPDGTAAPSSRIKDLVDLAAIAATQTIEAPAVRRALVSEFARRNLKLPSTVTVPDRVMWSAGYERMTRDMPVLARYQSYDDGHRLVRAFLEPVLADHVTGTWRPRQQKWG